MNKHSSFIVSISGGKDSIAMLLAVLEMAEQGLIDRASLLAHHQVVLEDWPGTVDYCQDVCRQLNVPLYCTQARYHGYACVACHHRFLASVSSTSPVYCRVCGSHDATFLRTVESVLDLVEWRQAWPSLAVRFCTSYFKRDNFNAWARTHADLLGAAPVICLGERALESRSRARLPAWRGRAGLKAGWMQEWRPVLSWKRIEVFRKMRQHGIEPHYCYAAQGMSEEEMYEIDQEGGPRMSCVMCFLKSAEQLRASYYVAEGRAVMERGIRVEQATGHTIKYGQSLERIIQ